jgi:hypothetical protein
MRRKNDAVAFADPGRTDASCGPVCDFDKAEAKGRIFRMVRIHSPEYIRADMKGD